MPTIDIPDKICPHCGGTKWYVRTNGKIDSCNNKKLERHNKYYKKVKTTEVFKRKKADLAINYYHKNSKKIKKRNAILRKPQWAKNTYKRNKEKILLKCKEYVANEEVKKKIRKNSKKRNELLSNNTLKNLIASDVRRTFSSVFSVKDIPQDLIELKRKQLLLKRKIKNNG
jgi:hypothetical protein